MSLEKKIASNLFWEFQNRVGSMVGMRVRHRYGIIDNIIAFGVACIEAGRTLEHDELKAFVDKRDTVWSVGQLVQDARQAAEDELGVQEYRKSIEHLTS
jgi:hypothetical protein